MTDIAKALEAIVRAEIGNDDEQIEKLLKDEVTWSQAGVDSLDMVELFMAIEDEFDVEIPDSVSEKMINFSSTVKAIENALATKPQMS